MVNVFFGSKSRLGICLTSIVLITLIAFPAYADQVVKPSSGGTINIGFATDPASPNPGDQTMLKINFINKQNTIQPHIDYKVSVMKGNDQVSGIPITHTAEGSVSIPMQFQNAGTYQVIVEVDGILFQPIPPETATFTVDVGSTSSSQPSQTVPEFGPVTSLILVFSIAGVVIASGRAKGFLNH